MSKERTYKVTYRIFPNEKVKQVSFHGKWLHPLYIQLIYDRRNTVYKCNLFDLYSKPKYGIRVAGEVIAPPIEEVIRREEKLVEFVINKHPDDFSFEIFKKDYDYYSQDLLDEMEPDFQFYLHTFFQDEGMPFLADSMSVGAPPCHLADVVKDLKRSLKPDLYNRLIEHSFDYAPPYLSLFRFAEQRGQRPLISMLLIEWDDTARIEEFKEFIDKNYPTVDISNIIDTLFKFIKN